MSLDKERQYTAIYFPEDMLEKKDIAYIKLLAIDANWSKLVQEMIDSVIEVTEKIAKQGKNFRHFKFEIVAFDRENTDNVIVVDERDSNGEKSSSGNSK